MAINTEKHSFFAMCQNSPTMSLVMIFYFCVLESAGKRNVLMPLRSSVVGVDRGDLSLPAVTGDFKLGG